MFVTCHDPDFHAVKGSNLAGAQNLINRAVSYVTFGKLNPKVLLVTGQIPSSDVAAHSDPRLALPVSGLSTFDVASAIPRSLSPPPLPLSTVNFASYDVIVVASDFGGWLSQRELNILITREQDIFNFVNAGGGVVALAESPGGSHSLTTGPGFGFFPFVLSGMALNQSEMGISVTPAGTAMGLTNTDVNGNASHCIFTGSAGLDVIDRDSKDETLSLATRGVPIGDGGPIGGTLKVCKVAGPGVALNTNYTFGGFGSTVVIPAGPAPGGFCKVVGSFPVGSNVAVNEVLASDTSVAIAVSPPGQLVGTPNLATGSVLVNVGPGVTEVTFTNRRTGFVEICKQSKGTPAVTGTFDFSVGGQTYTIPVGVCTGPIELPLGPNTITETFSATTVLAGCTAIPAPLTSCSTSSRSATVNVAPGGIAAQEIVTFTNSITNCCVVVDPTGTTAKCSPNPAVFGQVVSCALAVKDTASESAVNPPTPGGVVACTVGHATVVGTATLNEKGRAKVKLTPLSVGTHSVSCAYQGNSAFAPSTAPSVAEVITR